MAFSPDGRRFAGAGYYSAIGEVWEAESGASLFLLEGHHTRLRSVAWSVDGRWLASGDEAGVIVLRDAVSGAPVETFEAVQGEAVALAFSPDGEMLAVGSDRGSVALWSLDGLRPEGVWMPHRGGVSGLVYSPDGSLLISAGRDGAIRLWDAARLPGVEGGPALDRRLASYGRHGAPVRSLAISRDGSTLVSGGDDARVLVWRLPDG